MQVRRPPGLSGASRRAPNRPPDATARRCSSLVLVAALLAGLVVRTFVLRPLTVSSTSMEPTLCPGDRVLVNLWDPDLGDLSRDDLVALRPGRSEVPVVKRVVGLPGDEVAIRDALLYVNGELVDEPYVDHKSIDALFYGPGRGARGPLSGARATPGRPRSTRGPTARCRRTACSARSPLRLPSGDC